MQNDEAAVLQGEKEAEKMIVEAYSALLLAFLSTERLISFFFSIPFCSFFLLHILRAPIYSFDLQQEHPRINC